MGWFTNDTFNFFAELEFNNDREWFENNRKRYESAVKGPMTAFAAEMIPRMQELDPGIDTVASKAVFRIHRDTRFSKDKRPYKTNAGMVIARGGRHEPGVSGLYFHLDARRMAVASGLYFLEPAQLRAVRAHIVGHPDEFASLLADPEFVKYFREMAGEKNKILPEEFRAAAAAQPLLFNKQFFYWAEYDTEDAKRDDLPEFVMGHMRAAYPMNRFLGVALG